MFKSEGNVLCFALLKPAVVAIFKHKGTMSFREVGTFGRGSGVGSACLENDLKGSPPLLAKPFCSRCRGLPVSVFCTRIVSNTGVKNHPCCTGMLQRSLLGVGGRGECKV